MTGPKFDDADWNLDQALIWVATRRADLVNEATRWPGDADPDRRTWMMTRVEVALDDAEHGCLCPIVRPKAFCSGRFSVARSERT
jgi:hypothetical protein